MNANWIKVYSDTSSIRAHLLLAVLNDNGLHATLLDKKDSSYAGSFGDIEIYVPREESVEALKLVEEFQSSGS